MAGEAARLRGSGASSRQLLERALVLNPNLAPAWSASGWFRLYLGEPVDAN